jgi:hypothetical protein
VFEVMMRNVMIGLLALPAIAAASVPLVVAWQTLRRPSLADEGREPRKVWIRCHNSGGPFVFYVMAGSLERELNVGFTPRRVLRSYIGVHVERLHAIGFDI